MNSKTQLDYILNPVMETVRLSPLLPYPLPLQSETCCLSSGSNASSPSSVSSWNSDPKILAALLCASGSSVQLNIEKLSGLKSCMKIHPISNSVHSIPMSFVSSIPINDCAVGFASAKNEKLNLYSPAMTPTASLSPQLKTRVCKEKGCTSLAVSRRRCVRHGGGSRCVFNGCTKGAKLHNLCFQHGGSTICLASGCNSKAKRYGYCWSHGGGRICSHENCEKVAAQGGSCWAHGGGNRCKLKGCSKRSYQKHGYFCKRHAFYNV
ncbi:uncharacterized protein PHALS_00983 [Plasmopara halstedii]|uniref:WRKY19-like zinc finger domain-containing protein n=1 Tax=Plasmopara halstedii TaxID=4781 RepID=A0A0P1AVU4_PLAHL|nr:uncharacterized protein PHALS_00983 [Plasmopara halstedii]CEG44637.1 hypothetical protein PHALS_00983 [Plasmopara halstedii]|eukprot:XP_024581006.1 hypothetical protein PHALS_00983 [Plasmopara halstedii]